MVAMAATVPEGALVGLVRRALGIVVRIVLKRVGGPALAQNRSVREAIAALVAGRHVKHARDRHKDASKGQGRVSLPVGARVVPPATRRAPHVLGVLARA